MQLRLPDDAFSPIMDVDDVAATAEKETTPDVIVTEEDQDYIPKLLEKKDWEANLRMEDVLATAVELAKSHHVTQSLPAEEPALPVAMDETGAAVTHTKIPEAVPSSSFADAFKSHEWPILPGTIADNSIDYSPKMLEQVLSMDGILPSSTTKSTENNPPTTTTFPEKSPPDNVFKSLDWVLTELLDSGDGGDTPNKNKTCFAPDNIPSSEPSVLFEEAEGLSPKTDWEADFFDQLPMLLSSSSEVPASVKANTTAALSAVDACTTASGLLKTQPIIPPKKKRIRKKRKKVIPDHKVYVSKITPVDVLLGRGGRSNHHSGNKRYREEVENFRKIYDTMATPEEKTDISQALVDAIRIAGGRFLEKEDRVPDKIGQWYIVPNIVARRKASQALREDNDPIKRKAKRERYLAKKINNA